VAPPLIPHGISEKLKMLPKFTGPYDKKMFYTHTANTIR
jgi:hypothetical protein